MKNANSMAFEDVFFRIKSWFRQNSSYLFLYDNAEGCPNLHMYLPDGTHGSILIATRKKLHKIVGREELDTREFDLSDACAFLKKRLEFVNDAEAKQLSNMLGCIPLALEQAAAYMKEEEYSIVQYMDLFKQYRLKVLYKPSSDTDYDKTILTTWKITLDKMEMEESSTPSVTFFKMLAYCAPDEIPLQMFIKGQTELPEVIRDILHPNHVLVQNEMIGKLSNYSLLSVERKDNGETFLSIHRLIQEATIHNIGDSMKYLHDCFAVAKRVCRYTNDTKDNMDFFLKTFPHVVKVAEYAEEAFTHDNDTIERVGYI
jgi:hypothetical protein